MSETTAILKTASGQSAHRFDRLLDALDGVGRGANGVRAATQAEATERAGTALQGIAQALILCGHTHMPCMLRLADGRLIVNPGSVGLQGFDDDHEIGRAHV